MDKEYPIVKRIQGTDGIRGRVQKHEDCSIQHPLNAFLKLEILTDTFFEFYTYVYCQELLANHFAKPGDSVVIGWDPRDKEGVFNQAAIRGVQKAGLDVLVTGILPTPAIALYLLHSNAVCAFALTASHNPSDQNGIKIFLGYTGLKLFPLDDERFTSRLFQTDPIDLLNSPLVGQVFDHSQTACKTFIHFSLHSDNSWINDQSFHNNLIIIDAANGAFSALVKDVFSALPFYKVIYTNCDLTKEINQNSGVADLEGFHRIASKEIESSNGLFNKYDTLKLLLSEGREHRDQILEGLIFCSAIVFDGDGDRFYRLEYDPFQDDIIVISGDQLAFFQGLYLKKIGAWKENKPLFVNTVESDLEATRTAQINGFQTYQAAVGDKWILWNAALEEWKILSGLYLERSQLPQLKSEIERINLLLNNMSRDSSFDALTFTQELCSIKNLFKETCGVDSYHDVQQALSQSGSSQFMIGCEETGHTITLGMLKNDDRIQTVYIGNGLKSALNSFLAIEELNTHNSEDYYKWLYQPFASGYQKNIPIYYVDKTLLDPESEFCFSLKDYFKSQLEIYWKDVEIQEVYRPEEPQMLFFLISKSEQSLATIYVRNSGTEDKMSLYLRGRKLDQGLLDKIGTNFYHYLLPRVKNPQNDFAHAELSILHQLQKQPLAFDQITIMDSLSSSKERLFQEMSTKQKLIKAASLSSDQKKWKLTELGQMLINFSERSE